MPKIVPQKEDILPQISQAPPGSNIALGDIDIQNVSLRYGGLMTAPQEFRWD